VDVAERARAAVLQWVPVQARATGWDARPALVSGFASPHIALPLRWLQIPFPGSLHITSSRLCFVFEDKGVAPIKLPGKAIKAAAKRAADEQQGPCQGGHAW
jgi:hypothetical protein